MSGSDESHAIPPTPRLPDVGLCPGCGAHVTVGDRICDLCGADLVATPPKPPEKASSKPATPLATLQPMLSSTAADDELFALQHGLGEAPGELRRSILRGAIVGLVLAVAIVFGASAVRRPPASPPAPVKLPVGPAPRQVATADEIGIRVNGAAASDPGRSEAAARAVVESQFPELERAYLQALQSGSAEGVLTLHMTVGEDGTIDYVRVSPLGIGSASFVAAVEAQAHAWRFPVASAGVASVHYPIVFYLPKTDPHQLVARVGGASAPPTAPDPGDVDSGAAGAPAGGRLPERQILQETQLHGGPSWSSAVLRDLDPGESVIEVGKQGDWVKVTTTDPGAEPGFVWREHVSSD